MKGMKQYSGHDYAHLCDIGPEGSRSICKAYNDIEEMPNGSDSDSTARAVSAAAGSFLESATDFLCSDLAHHLQDLEFGRSCQDPVVDPYVSNNPLSWKVLPYISIHKIPGFPQYPVPSNPVLTFGHMHVPNVSPQSYACSISDSQQQQTGTQPFFPLVWRGICPLLILSRWYEKKSHESCNDCRGVVCTIIICNVLLKDAVKKQHDTMTTEAELAEDCRGTGMG
jgi:hypothetical protein